MAYRSGESTAVLVFEGCAAIQFGYPNDEALEGHPLWGFGLAYHGAFEVVDSPWRSALEAQNAVAFPDTAWGEGLRHFVLTFHDTTFECLSAGVGVAWSDETPESAGSRAIW